MYISTVRELMAQYKLDLDYIRHSIVVAKESEIYNAYSKYIIADFEDTANITVDGAILIPRGGK